MSTTPITPGVYFGLPEDDYFAADALGQSDLKLIRTSPPDWWWESAHNTARNPYVEDRADSDGRRFGKALHKRILEGQAAFDAAYALPPEPPADALVTKDDIIARLADLGETHRKSDTKSALIEVMRSAEACLGVEPAVVLDEWKAATDALLGGREVIKPQWHWSIMLVARMLENHATLSKAFTGGAPEVSVFWEDERTGIMLRARMDYLKPQGVMDLKSVSNWSGAEMRRAAVQEVARRDYDMQAHLYHVARRMLAEHVREGRVHGDVDPAFLKAVADAEDWAFVFVFMKTMGYPDLLPLRIDRGSYVEEAAGRKVERALDLFCQYRERFGMDQPWITERPIWTPRLEEWPSWIAEGGFQE